MKLTKENFNKVFDYIDDQVNSTNGEFDKETDIVDAVQRTVEMIKESDLDETREKNSKQIDHEKKVFGGC
jgi:hypothetical protein